MYRFLLPFLSLFLSFPAVGQDTLNGVVVAELFTSQSCSSCPAADAVLQKIAKNDNVIALSCHVTYWDHLHWKDTLSQDFCTVRQRDYARQLKNGSRVYTPQLVVNGQSELVGSRKLSVINTISNHARKGATPISLSESSSGNLKLDLPQFKEGKFELVLLTYKNSHTQRITSGENRGRTVTYTNSVTDMKLLEYWNGLRHSEEYDVSHLKSLGDGFVVLAQNMRSGEIVAAGRLIF